MMVQAADLVDPTNAVAASYFDEEGRQVLAVDALGGKTETDYNGLGLPIETRSYFTGGPCANDNNANYDSRSTTTYDSQWREAANEVRHPAQCATGSAHTTTTVYRADHPLPSSTTDARGKQTILDYQSMSNGSASGIRLISIDGPSGERTEWTYNASGLPAQKKVKTTATAWITTTYGFTGANLTSRTLDPAGVNSITAFGYDTVGNATSVTDPNGNQTTIAYDLMRRMTGVTRPLGAITQIKRDADGKVTKQCEATAASPGDCITNATNWAITSYAYTPSFKVSSVTDPDGYVTDYSYTARDEVDIVTRWLDLAKTSARREKTEYDVAGQATKLWKAWGDPLQQVYQQNAYNGASGLVATVMDANGNQTSYSYDGYGRLKKTCFPGGGAPPQLASTSDCETYSYDANDNMTVKVTRRGYNNGGAPTEQIDYTYDDSNRLTQRHVPGSADGTVANENYDFTYDFAGRQVTGFHWNFTQTTLYDTAGRVSQRSSNGNAATLVAYQYDAAGNVAKLTYPDGYYVSHVYDALNRVSRTCEMVASAACATAAVSGSTPLLAQVGYDRQSRRQSVDYRNGTSADYAYTKRGDLTDLDWSQPVTPPLNPVFAAYDLDYNGVGQLVADTVSDPLLRWSPTSNVTDNYTPNGRNQYASINGVSPVHDGNGNLATDQNGRTFLYSAENQLIKAFAVGSALITHAAYNSDGTRRYHWGAGTVVQDVYDGDQEIYETDGSWAKLRRYVRLPGSVDEAFLMIDYTLSGGCTNAANGAAACERWTHQDRLGSTVAVSNSAGGMVDRFKYGPYGELTGQSTSGFPFRFTGQKLDAETGLYYYKARYYDPATGRFLQTDPIGYEDQINLYLYAENDPFNLVDQNGEEAGCISLNRDCFGRDNTQEDYDRTVEDLKRVAPYALLFLPTPEDAVLGVLLVRAGSTRLILFLIRQELRSGKRLVLYSGAKPVLGKDEFAFKVGKFFWSRGVNDKAMKQVIKARAYVRDSHIDKSGKLIEAKSGSILERERKQLQKAGYKFNEKTGNWEPPEPCNSAQSRLCRSS